MKKLGILILSLSVLLAMALPAFATNITQSGASQEGAVTASYLDGTASTSVISVNIAWNGMEFVYQADSEPIWIPESHSYSVTPGGWQESNASITVTNHSNAIVQAAIEYTPKDAFSETSMSFTDKTPYIGSAFTNETGSGKESSAIIRAIPGGVMAKSTEKATIGSITVTINALPESDELYTTACQYFYTLIGSTLIGESAADRGELYFESQDVADQISDTLSNAINVITGSSSTAQKNAALNTVIDAFYMALQIKQ